MRLREKGLNITAALERRSLAALIVVEILLFTAITALRFYLNAEFSFSFMYLIPVSFAAWFFSSRAGALVALASTAAMVIFDLEPPGRYSSREIAAWDLAMNLGIYLFIVFVLSEVRALYRRERELSRHDPLTGLLNRRAFEEAVELECERSERAGHPLSLAYVDVDDFKLLNDRLGHAAGDSLLRAAARAMNDSVRSMDTVARLGGDEFAILFPEAGPEAACAAVEKLQGRLSQLPSRAEWQTSFSLGAVTLNDGGGEAEQLIQQADRVMYEVKQSGKGAAQHRTLGRFRPPRAV